MNTTNQIAASLVVLVIVGQLLVVFWRWTARQYRCLTHWTKTGRWVAL